MKETADCDEADVLIEEIPVYLSQVEDGFLYMLQYPTHRADSMQMDYSVTEARLRPECHQMELVQHLNMNSTYDCSKGEQLALNVDGAHRDKRDARDNCFPAGMVDRIMLRSEGSLQHADRHYATCHLVPGVGLVMVQVDDVLALKPALDYVDKADNRVKSEKKAEEEGDDGSDTEDANTRAVTVRFERTENDRMRNARERSFTHHQRRIQEEAWIKMSYMGQDDMYCNHIRQNTFENIDTERVDQFHLPPSHLLSLLVPPSTTIPTLKPAAMPDSAAPTTAAAALAVEPEPLDIPKSVLYACTLEKQIEIIMRKVGVARFKDILEYLEPEKGRSNSSLIEKVQACATLVQGCWVLKSDLLYPAAPPIAVSSSSSSVLHHAAARSSRSEKKIINRFQTEAGTPHADMQKAREYALYLLTTQEYLERDTLASYVPMPGDDLLSMLRGIAKPARQQDGSSTGRWIFTLAKDELFISQFNEVNKRYLMKWEYQFKTRITPR